MIEVSIPDEVELYDESKNEFITVPPTKIQMEHSLVSLRTWEGKWKQPFLSTNKTPEQMLDYLRIMTLNEGVHAYAYLVIPESEMKRIVDYIKDKKTAMTINDSLIGAAKSRNEFISAETIYWWMIALQIPWEFERWHLEQLLALIKFVSIKNDPKSQKKMTQRDAILRNAEINARNRAKYNTKG